MTGPEDAAGNTDHGTALGRQGRDLALLRAPPHASFLPSRAVWAAARRGGVKTSATG